MPLVMSNNVLPHSNNNIKKATNDTARTIHRTYAKIRFQPEAPGRRACF